MAHATRPKSRRDGTVALTTGDPVTHTIGCEEGNLAITGLSADQREVIAVEHRGSFVTLIDGAQTYPTFTLTAYVRDLVDGAYSTLLGMATRTGSSASAVSTLGAGSAVPYTVDLDWTIAGTTHNEGADHTVSLDDCRITDVGLNEGEIDTISISGTCYGAIAFT